MVGGVQIHAASTVKAGGGRAGLEVLAGRTPMGLRTPAPVVKVAILFTRASIAAWFVVAGVIYGAVVRIPSRLAVARVRAHIIVPLAVTMDARFVLEATVLFFACRAIVTCKTKQNSLKYTTTAAAAITTILLSLYNNNNNKPLLSIISIVQ